MSNTTVSTGKAESRCSESCRLMVRMTAVGTVFQLAMVIAGHYNEFVKDNLFAGLGMFISLVVAAMYARSGARSVGTAAAGGAVVGGVCALLGIGVSVLLKDSEPMILAFGSIGSAVAGSIGGAVAYLVVGKKR